MNYKLFVLVAGLLLVGVVSADTYTFYPTDNETVKRASTNEDWATITGGAGTAVDGSANVTLTTLSGSTNGRFNNNKRFLVSFDTSAIPDTDTITSATLSLHGAYQDGSQAGLGTTGFGTTVVNASPASDTLFISTDYNKIGSVILSNIMPYADWKMYGRNNYTLTSGGLERVNTTGITVLGVRHTWDLNGTFGGTWASAKYTGHAIMMSSYGGTTYDPLLEVVTTPAVSAPVASFTLDRTLTRIPKLVTATDTSTNTPTSWQWSWGDGTANSTTQNPTHTYTKRGKFTINMAATNAGGTGVATASTVRVVGYENP